MQLRLEGVTFYFQSPFDYEGASLGNPCLRATVCTYTQNKWRRFTTRSIWYISRSVLLSLTVVLWKKIGRCTALKRLCQYAAQCHATSVKWDECWHLLTGSFPCSIRLAEQNEGRAARRLDRRSYSAFCSSLLFNSCKNPLTVLGVGVVYKDGSRLQLHEMTGLYCSVNNQWNKSSAKLEASRV